MGDLAELAARTRFPGRVRQFAAPDPGQALALAVGAAWAERPRGGHAAAVVPPADRRQPLVAEALALAGRLALPNLLVVPAADPAVPVEALDPAERQPVRLASLGRDLVPRWPADRLPDALQHLAWREPLLLLPHADARWGLGAAALLALAWIAGDGRRVAWLLPRGAPLGEWSSALALVGSMQLALKLLADPADLPWPPEQRGLARWWLAAPGPEDAAGVLAWALAGEEPVLAALPTACPAGAAWMPGSARRVAEGRGGGTVLCHARSAAVSALAAERGAGILHLTSLLPVPVAELLAATPPLLTDDEHLARHLAPLAALDPRLHCTLAPPRSGADSPR